MKAAWFSSGKQGLTSEDVATPAAAPVTPSAQ